VFKRPSKSLKILFKRPFKVRLKVFERPFKGLLKHFKRFFKGLFKGLLKAFKWTFKERSYRGEILSELIVRQTSWGSSRGPGECQREGQDDQGEIQEPMGIPIAVFKSPRSSLGTLGILQS